MAIEIKILNHCDVDILKMSIQMYSIARSISHEPLSSSAILAII